MIKSDHEMKLKARNQMKAAMTLDGRSALGVGSSLSIRGLLKSQALIRPTFELTMWGLKQLVYPAHPRCHNMFCNNILNKQSATGILYTDISDHFPIFYIDYSSKISMSPKFIKKRCFSPDNIEKFKNECDSHNWNQVLESNDPQDAFTSFHNIFINLYDTCFPIKTIKLSYRNRKPWLTDGLSCLTKIKQISSSHGLSSRISYARKKVKFLLEILYQ